MSKVAIVVLIFLTIWMLLTVGIHILWVWLADPPDEKDEDYYNRFDS